MWGKWNNKIGINCKTKVDEIGSSSEVSFLDKWNQKWLWEWMPYFLILFSSNAALPKAPVITTPFLKSSLSQIISFYNTESYPSAINVKCVISLVYSSP